MLEATHSSGVMVKAECSVSVLVEGLRQDSATAVP